MSHASSRAKTRKRITHRGTTFHFSQKHADYAINFFEQMLCHSKGEWAGKPFHLIPYQEEFLTEVFGWVDKNGKRMVRSAYLEVPKKNGKSPLASGIALLLLVADGEAGAEVVIASNDREQAGIVFGYAEDMVRLSPYLEKRLKVISSRKRIIDHQSGSFMCAVSSDVPTKHGFNLSGMVFDELHAQKNRELWDTLATGTGARSQPLTLAITTAGVYSENSICWEQHQYALEVIKDPMSDPTHYAMIFSADKDDDWTCPEVWKKANPALGIFRSIEQLHAECEKAKRSPAYQNTFRRLFLNQWTAQVERWLDIGEWQKTAGEVHEEDLVGELCYGGLDLSYRKDLTAFVMVFPDEGGYYDVLCRFFIPEEGLIERVRRDRVPYDSWVENGVVRACKGNVIEKEDIMDQLKADCQKFFVSQIAYDPFGTKFFAQDIGKETGSQMLEFRQGFLSMSEPSKLLIDLTAGRKLRHGNNPCLSWQAEGVTVAQDQAGNIKPVKTHKLKTVARIDGIVALIMALATANKEQNLVYNERGIIMI